MLFLKLFVFFSKAFCCGLEALRESFNLGPRRLGCCGLPLTDGYELARRVRSQPYGKKVLLVALTGYGAPEQRAEALEAGFDLNLVKPVEPEQLARLIAQPYR